MPTSTSTVNSGKPAGSRTVDLGGPQSVRTVTVQAVTIVTGIDGGTFNFNPLGSSRLFYAAPSSPVLGSTLDMTQNGVFLYVVAETNMTIAGDPTISTREAFVADLCRDTRKTGKRATRFSEQVPPALRRLSVSFSYPWTLPRSVHG
ncbi:hypothetical protein [uncultured Sulfitobacter sp.]|uniref:hypothetical protein n=1 Tax=uncultured Sulfitobacter sp. TaxID=191468 RepID=UPI00262FDFA9|nr:hypothetical protein [uncultured Sulfitobacter sp.]